MKSSVTRAQGIVRRQIIQQFLSFPVITLRKAKRRELALGQNRESGRAHKLYLENLQIGADELEGDVGGGALVGRGAVAAHEIALERLVLPGLDEDQGPGQQAGIGVQPGGLLQVLRGQGRALQDQGDGQEEGEELLLQEVDVLRVVLTA